MSNLIVKWKKVLFSHQLQPPIIDWIDLGNGTMFRIFSFYADLPRHGLMVGIERLGCFFFGVSDKYKHGGYVSKKLNLCEADANNLADWINVQTHDDWEPIIYQGSYNENYIINVERYGLIGERWTIPLHPEIIIIGNNETKG